MRLAWGSQNVCLAHAGAAPEQQYMTKTIYNFTAITNHTMSSAASKCAAAQGFVSIQILCLALNTDDPAHRTSQGPWQLHVNFVTLTRFKPAGRTVHAWARNETQHHLLLCRPLLPSRRFASPAGLLYISFCHLLYSTFCSATMAECSITSVQVLNNPAPFTDPIVLEVQYECLSSLQDDLEWRINYVGSAESDQYDQILDSALVGPVQQGSFKFRMEAPAPDPCK
jgi:hypothetical protein